MNLIDVYPTTDNKVEFLYELLGERKPYQSISHKEMPTLLDHWKYVCSKPHKAWYIVSFSNLAGSFVGSIYLSKKDEIGLFISNNHQRQTYGRAALQMLYNLHPEVKQFTANIAPFNSRSIAFFLNRGFALDHALKDDKNNIIQYVCKMTNPEYKAS